jgi:alpha-beta hydrolase superfamily lysophospholipase
MRVERYGPEDTADLVWVLGWGNRIAHENVRWLVDGFVDAGYRVHVFEIPTEITDFETDWVEPVRGYTQRLDSFRLLGHSAGGLIAAYLSGAETTTYLSPFWGFPDGQVGLDEPLLALASALPVSAGLLPSGAASREGLGALATDEQLHDVPRVAAPTFVREARRAHEGRPPVEDDAVVFCSLSDPVVDLNAIGAAVPAERTVLYDGGHELFSSERRETYLDRLLVAVTYGAEALEL